MLGTLTYVYVQRVSEMFYTLGYLDAKSWAYRTYSARAEIFVVLVLIIYKYNETHVHLSDDIVGFFCLNMNLGFHKTHQQHFTVLFNLPLPFVSAETRHKLSEVQKQPKSRWQRKAFC